MTVTGPTASAYTTPLSCGASAYQGWAPFVIYEYIDIPPFSVKPGDVLALPLVSPLVRYVTFNSIAFSTPSTQSSAGFINVVYGSPDPIGIANGLELQFRITGSYTFSGGGLLLRFETSAVPPYGVQVQCGSDHQAPKQSETGG
jgi:hypothetical protein